MRKKSFVLLLSICLTFVILILPFAGACKAPGGGAIELDAVSFHALDLEGAHFLKVFVERVNERAQGKLRINLVGGPEVIPQNDQPEAVRTGAMDIAMSDASELVIAADLFDLSRHTLPEEKKKGFHDWMVEQYKEAGLFYLWRIVDGNGFHLYTTFKVSKPEDFAGKKMRMAPPYVPIYNGLGVSGVKIPMPETYTALERGLVEGMGGKHFDVIGFSMYEVLDYWIDHTFYSNSGEPIVVNLEKWNQLPKNLQKLVIEVTDELNPEIDAYFSQRRVEWGKTLQDNGMEPITFSPADAERYLGYAYDNLWKEVEEKLDPAIFMKGKELLTK